MEMENKEMDYRGVIKKQINRLQLMQMEIDFNNSSSSNSACRIAETILLLCKEIQELPIE